MFLSIKKIPKTNWSSSKPLNFKPKIITFVYLSIGLALFGLGEGLLIVSTTGNSPWSVLAEGLSLKTGNEQILIDFYNKLILLIEVSMNEKTASQFFTKKFEINTLSVKKKDLTKISRKFDQIWIHDRGSIWGAKKGNDWLKTPKIKGTPGYASLRGFLMGLSRPMLIFKQKYNKNLDWNRFKLYKFIINYDSIPKNNIYTNSFIPNLKNNKTFYSESIKQHIDPMHATYADNFGKKDRSKSSSIHKSSSLSSLSTESSGLKYSSSDPISED